MNAALAIVVLLLLQVPHGHLDGDTVVLYMTRRSE